MSRGQLLPVLVLVRVSLGSDVAMQGSRLRHQLESGASTSVLTIIGASACRWLAYCEVGDDADA
jgi:hypothetical protein